MTPAPKPDARTRGRKRGLRVINDPSAPAGDLPTIATTDETGRRRPAADVLIDIGLTASLFTDPAGDAFAKIDRGGHVEFHALESRAFRKWLASRYYKLTSRGANAAALGDALATLTAAADDAGNVRPVAMRTARDQLAVILDTGLPDWQTIRCSGPGWSLQAGGDIAFRRPQKMLAFPAPTTGGQPAPEAFARLWRYVNVAEEDRVLVAAFLLGALRPEGPYPLLLVAGEQGTGKSTFSRILKRLIDPSAAPLRPPPKEPRDVLVAALNSWLLCLDNLSFMPAELSDTLCRIATGGAIGERTLFSNVEETLIEVQRPMVLNGIAELATRPDLAQRGIHVELQPGHQTRTESELWRDFEDDAPAIFAALLAGICRAAGHEDTTSMPGPMPRMADFARWSCAGLPALGFTPEEFAAAYAGNQAAGLRLGLESSTPGRAIARLMTARSEWNGTATELLALLRDTTDPSDHKARDWPASPRSLSAALKRLAPALRAAGVSIQTGRTNRGSDIQLRRHPAPDDLEF